MLTTAILTGLGVPVQADEPWDTIDEIREGDRPCDQAVYARACVHFTLQDDQPCAEFQVFFDYVIDNPEGYAEHWAGWSWSIDSDYGYGDWDDMDPHVAGSGGAVPSAGLQAYANTPYIPLGEIDEGETVTLSASAWTAGLAGGTDDEGPNVHSAKFEVVLKCQDGVLIVDSKTAETLQRTIQGE